MCGDSCGKRGIGETPKCLARGGSPAARGKRSIFPQRGYPFFSYYSSSFFYVESFVSALLF
nr:hypothetical protein [Lentibacillus persicus]